MASTQQIEEAPWLDDAPGDWTRFRVKDIAALSPSLSEGTPAPTETCTVVPMESLSVTGEISYDGQSYFQDVSSGLPNFETDDVLFAKITPCMENGKGAHVVGLPTRYAFGSTEFHVLRPGHKVDARFLYYYTFNPVFRHYAAENMTGAAGQKRVSSRFLNYTPIWLPDIEEQRRIATYLDNACRAVDGAIDAKRKQLKTLADLRKTIIHKAVTRGLDDSVEMKPSGVDWLGEIPAHWDAARIKRVLLRLDYGTSDSSNSEGQFPVLKMGHILDGEIVYSKLDYVDEIPSELILEKGDILYNRTNSPDQVGKAAIFRGSKKDGITFASYLVRLRVNHRVDPHFLNYVVNSKCFLAYVRRLAIPSVQQSNLNSTRYSLVFVPLPPMPEQERIAVYLDDMCGRHCDVCERLSKQLDLLQDYRKSLIHECVTGKRRITDADIQKVKEHV